MKVILTENGATVDAHDLAPLLGLEPAEVPIKMRAGEITSQSEIGIDDDAGKIRLTFWYSGQRIRLICDNDGSVLKTTRTGSSR